MKAPSALLCAAILSVPALAIHQEDAPATVGNRFRAGEESHWVFEQGADRIGHCWSRYEGTTDLAGVRAHLFRGRVALSIELPQGLLEQRYTSELWTDDHARPLHFVMHANVSDAYQGIEIAIDGNTAKATIRQGVTERTVDVKIAEDSYLLANNFISHLELLLALKAPGEGEKTAYNLLSANMLQPLPLAVEHADTFVGTGGQPGGHVFKDSLGETLHQSDDGRILTVEVPAQGLSMRRVDEPAEPFEIAPPTREEPPDFDRDAVTITYGDVTIAGTVTRPKGAEGRLPAVFFVSGSGSQDRDGFASGVDVGTHEILDRLTADGFCVLRVDDRGAGESEGPTEGLTFDDLVEDARRCVQYLMARDDVDPARVAVIGHSEGGQTAPILAAPMEEIAAIVLMAAPGRPLTALAIEQLSRGMRENGKTDEELAVFESSAKTFFASVAAGEQVDPSSLPDELQMFASMQPWLRSHAKQDPCAILAQVKCPVLLLQGERDIQVLADKDAPALAAALEQAGHEDYELVVFPELDHLFKKTVGEESSGLDYFKKRPVDPAFLDKVSGWLSERLLDSE